MKLVGLFSAKRVDDYAKNLAREFSARCPLPTDRQRAQIPQSKIDSALGEIFGQAQVFRRENRLGIFKRARFAKTFQDELAGLGYAPELVTKVTTALVVNALSGG